MGRGFNNNYPRGRRGGVNRIASLVAAFCLLATLSAAHAQLTPERLSQLIEQQRFEEAYELALEHRAELEGELAFDFLFGVAAINSGHLSEGIFALERVVMRRPAFTRARLELARGYFLRGEDIRADHHFEIVLAQDPPAPVVATVERFQQRIQARADRYTTTVTGWLEAGIATDSNVNSATDADTVDTIFGPITLADEAKEKGDNVLRTAGQVRVSRPVNPDQTVFVSGDIESRNHDDEDDFDTLRAGVRVGTTFYGENLNTTLALRSQRFYLDGDRYQDLDGFSATLANPLSARTMAQIGLQYLRLRYEERPNRDANMTLGSAGLTHIWEARWRPVTSFAIFGGHESALESTAAARANTERDLYGLNAGLMLHPAPEWRVTTRAQYRRSNYRGVNILLGDTRREDFYQAAIEVDWMPTVNWRIGPSLQYSENDANLDLFEYDRTVFEIRARYSFY